MDYQNCCWLILGRSSQHYSKQSNIWKVSHKTDGRFWNIYKDPDFLRRKPVLTYFSILSIMDIRIFHKRKNTHSYSNLYSVQMFLHMSHCKSIIVFLLPDSRCHWCISGSSCWRRRKLVGLMMSNLWLPMGLRSPQTGWGWYVLIME